MGLWGGSGRATPLPCLAGIGPYLSRIRPKYGPGLKSGRRVLEAHPPTWKRPILTARSMMTWTGGRKPGELAGAHRRGASGPWAESARPSELFEQGG
jgi:hypothetical protein